MISSRAFPAKSWCARRQRSIARTTLAPINNDTKTLSAREALHSLHMSCSAYYYDRAARGIGIPAEVSVQLLAIAQTIFDGRNYATALSDAIDFFSRTPASVENADIREAIKTAKLALKAALQDTQTELPIVSVRAADPGDWLL